MNSRDLQLSTHVKGLSPARDLSSEFNRRARMFSSRVARTARKSRRHSHRRTAAGNRFTSFLTFQLYKHPSPYKDTLLEITRLSICIHKVKRTKTLLPLVNIQRLRTFLARLVLTWPPPCHQKGKSLFSPHAGARACMYIYIYTLQHAEKASQTSLQSLYTPAAQKSGVAAFHASPNHEPPLLPCVHGSRGKGRRRKMQMPVSIPSPIGIPLGVGAHFLLA